MSRPHLIYVAIGFPPAAKSSAYRLRETANQFVQAGWDVTVINTSEESWEREFGLDRTLSEGVDPRVRVVELPLLRHDLATDIREFSEAQALDPQAWGAAWRESGLTSFPELSFGSWRAALEQAALDIHQERPADLVLATCAPYTTMAVARRLWDEVGVPYAIDYRDGWAIDVIGGEVAFPEDDERGKWERRVLQDAVSLWVVNEPIAEFYRKRFPDLAHKIHVVRNGFDRASVPGRTRRPDPEAGLTFGHLGVLTSPPWMLEAVLEAWRRARLRDPLVARSRLVFRGPMGFGAGRESNRHSAVLHESAEHGVTFGGSAPKGEVPDIIGAWDVLVAMIMGGRYMTSGKIYEYSASGLPIMSVHEIEHDACSVLEGRPLWVPPVGFDVYRLTESFVAAAHVAATATDDERKAARRHAEQFERVAQLRPAIAALGASLGQSRVRGLERSVDERQGS